MMGWMYAYAGTSARMSGVGTFVDMATGPDDVRFQGKTGSSADTAKLTRLTRTGHRQRPNSRTRPVRHASLN